MIRKLISSWISLAMKKEEVFNEKFYWFFTNGNKERSKFWELQTIKNKKVWKQIE